MRRLIPILLTLAACDAPPPELEPRTGAPAPYGDEIAWPDCEAAGTYDHACDPTWACVEAEFLGEMEADEAHALAVYEITSCRAQCTRDHLACLEDPEAFALECGACNVVHAECMDGCIPPGWDG